MWIAAQDSEPVLLAPRPLRFAGSARTETSIQGDVTAQASLEPAFLQLPVPRAAYRFS